MDWATGLKIVELLASCKTEVLLWHQAGETRPWVERIALPLKPVCKGAIHPAICPRSPVLWKCLKKVPSLPELACLAVASQPLHLSY